MLAVSALRFLEITYAFFTFKLGRRYEGRVLDAILTSRLCAYQLLHVQALNYSYNINESKASI